MRRPRQEGHPGPPYEPGIILAVNFNTLVEEMAAQPASAHRDQGHHRASSAPLSPNSVTKQNTAPAQQEPLQGVCRAAAIGRPSPCPSNPDDRPVLSRRWPAAYTVSRPGLNSSAAGTTLHRLPEFKEAWKNDEAIHSIRQRVTMAQRSCVEEAMGRANTRFTADIGTDTAAQRRRVRAATFRTTFPATSPERPA